MTSEEIWLWPCVLLPVYWRKIVVSMSIWISQYWPQKYWQSYWIYHWLKYHSFAERRFMWGFLLCRNTGWAPLTGHDDHCGNYPLTLGRGSPSSWLLLNIDLDVLKMQWAYDNDITQMLTDTHIQAQRGKRKKLNLKK